MLVTDTPQSCCSTVKLMSVKEYAVAQLQVSCNPQAVSNHTVPLNDMPHQCELAIAPMALAYHGCTKLVCRPSKV